jgi:ABC-type sugar transport system ATPase subunit
MMPEPALALEVSELSKTFSGQRALDQVSIEVRRGEVHALLGENGSGKSTLIKCLAGVYQPDPGGRLAFGGKEMDIPFLPADSLRAGCAFIHQELGLVPTLSVRENLALSGGFLTGAGGRVRWSAETARARDLLEPFSAHIRPEALVESLPQADRTLVAIARGMKGAESGGCLLVLDEPTAALPEGEVDELFAAIRQLKENGLGILYVTHRLSEVFELADRATVLRDGSKVGTHDVAELDEPSLIQLLVGRSLSTYYPPVEQTTRERVVLSASGICGVRVKDASFKVYAGEVVGIAGLLGSGRSELGRLIFGAQQLTGGTLEMEGRPLDLRSPRDGIERGIALVPEDRTVGGSHQTMSLAENITLPELHSLSRFGRLRKRAERRKVKELIEQYNVKPPQPAKRFATLSGGNQQKAILAKWMRLDPQLLILDEPVQGVDIGARAEIYAMLEKAAAAGAGIVMIDSEIEDLCRLCDRVLVLVDGRIVAELSGEAADSGRVTEAIYSEEARA